MYNLSYYPFFCIKSIKVQIQEKGECGRQKIFNKIVNTNVICSIFRYTC